MMNYVILGNGIIGLSTAFQLAKRASDADRITIIGPARREGSATEAAGAMLNSFAEVEADGLNHEIDLYRFELSREATRLWPLFDDSITSTGQSCSSGRSALIPAHRFDKGTYIINNTFADSLDDDNFNAIRDALQTFNEGFEDIDPHDIPSYEPEQRSRATRAMLIHGEGWMNPRLVIDRLEKVLRLFPQVTFIDGYAESLTQTNGSLVGVMLSNGRMIEADEYLVATGASATALFAQSNLGIEIQPIFYGVGTSVEIINSGQPQPKCIRTPNRGLACGVYSIPYFQGNDEANDHILIGATNRISPTPVSLTNLSSVESLTRAAMEQINRNYYRAQLFRINVGWRPTSQDAYPLVGRSSIANLTIVTGTKRDGFHLAPLLSEMTADLMQGKQIDPRMQVFHPERKPLRTLTREQGVEKAVRHTLSAWYQHGYNPAKSRMPDMVTASVRDEVERLHDQVGAKDWGIPPEMHDMYRYGHAIA
jgi:glycine/D-amino acid oxidase-like deaminating enzyme